MTPSKPLLGLVLMTKNEATNLPRCIESVKPFIDTWTVSDTGSRDDTSKIAGELLADLPGKVFRHKWRDFGHNRTLALRTAKDTARWLLFLDADMEVTWVWDDFRKWLAGRKSVDALMVHIDDHGTNTPLPLLVRGGLDWQYVGATHEYLDPAGRTRMQLNGLNIVHHNSKTPEQMEAKLRGDIELLRPAFKLKDPRAVFYTAESRRYLGEHEQAAMLYDLRATLNGFEEEVWYSRFQAANCRKDIGGLLNVWMERQYRHEPLLVAARIVAERGGGDDVLFLERSP